MLQRIRLIIILATLATQSVLAEGVADIWLGRAIAQIQNKGVEINFRINDDGTRINGHLLMEGSNYYFGTDEMKIWFNGTTQWTLQANSDYSELYINEPTLEEQQSINPYLLLKDYQERYTATDGGDKTISGILLHEVQLKAKDPQQEISSLNIYLKSTGELAAIRLFLPNSSSYKIDIRSIRSGLTFPKQTFTYDSKAHPADEVIDLR